MEIVAIILFVLIFILILFGYPVALTLGGLSTIVGLIFVPDFLDLLPLRIMGVMNNYVLLAVPLFIYMGLMLEKSGLAESLLETMAILFGKINGGLAISVIVVGALLAASTGIVGATVVTMGLISLPTMLKRNYNVKIATGTISSSGTLGQIIPPSVVLVLLGSVLNVPVGDLFSAAIVPGVILVGAYIIYVLVYARLNPEEAPAMPAEEVRKFKSEDFAIKVIQAFLLPLLLIVAVLGSIFTGIASPTEAAAVGAMGAIILTAIQKKLNLDVLKKVMVETTHLTSMVFLILLGATTFSLVFRGMNGDDYLVNMITSADLSPHVFLLIVMLVVFIAGFFIDFIEIIFIIVPVVSPLFIQLGINPLWAGILIALNLQTSFLTPPFGFSLFYLKGVAPPEVRTVDIYKGVVPFLIIQIIVLAMVFFFPGMLWTP
ncbi:MAG: TRAP transporter large permease subunit [Saprospiraceae bacterium]|nr:TRAP transporter large permease subunit [Saprospiraceae bacterium]